MLKLSPNQVGTNINKDDHKAFKIIGEAPGQRVGRVLLVFFIISVGIMFYHGPKTSEPMVFSRL